MRRWGWGLPRHSRRRIFIIVIFAIGCQPFGVGPESKKKLSSLQEKVDQQSDLRSPLQGFLAFHIARRSPLIQEVQNDEIFCKLSLFILLICAKFVYNHLPPLGSFHLLLLLQLLSCLFPQQQLEIPCCSYFVVMMCYQTSYPQFLFPLRGHEALLGFFPRGLSFEASSHLRLLPVDVRHLAGEEISVFKQFPTIFF